MDTLSTLRFPAMNIDPTRGSSEDNGGSLLQSTSSHTQPQFALRHIANSAAVVDTKSDRPPHHLGEGSATENVWYCGGCGDGPIPNWNPVCVSCNSTKNDSCTAEGPQAHHDNIHGFTEDGSEPETSWFCDNCGDGPHQDWNPVCAECGHQRGDCCKTETI